MRYSKQREMIMQTVKALHNHPTAEEIHRETAKACPTLSLGTVYRDLNALVAAGQIRRVPIPGKADRYDDTLAPHSHLYCTCCGTVEDVELDEQQVIRLIKNPQNLINGCIVTFYGVCAACRVRSVQG